MERECPKDVILELSLSKYQGADSILWGGSTQRGNHTDKSDLDCVVIYSHVDKPYRESFVFKGWPVDCFVNDIESLHYFFIELDAPSAHPVLLGLVANSVALPKDTALSTRCQKLAKNILAKGPYGLSEHALAFRRYSITDLLDDLHSAEPGGEALAIAGELFYQLIDFYLRANQKWTAKGKWLIRRLNQEDPKLANQVSAAFKDYYAHQHVESIVKVVENVLSPFGGTLWDGYHLPGQTDWKKALEE